MKRWFGVITFLLSVVTLWPWFGCVREVICGATLGGLAVVMTITVWFVVVWVILTMVVIFLNRRGKIPKKFILLYPTCVVVVFSLWIISRNLITKVSSDTTKSQMAKTIDKIKVGVGEERVVNGSYFYTLKVISMLDLPREVHIGTEIDALYRELSGNANRFGIDDEYYSLNKNRIFVINPGENEIEIEVRIFPEKINNLTLMPGEEYRRDSDVNISYVLWILEPRSKVESSLVNLFEHSYGTSTNKVFRVEGEFVSKVLSSLR